MNAVPNTLHEVIMNKHIEQIINAKRDQFESEYSDILLWYFKDRELNGWRFVMLDRNNQDRRLVRILSGDTLAQAFTDVLWYTFTFMRNELMGC